MPLLQKIEAIRQSLIIKAGTEYYQEDQHGQREGLRFAADALETLLWDAGYFLQQWADAVAEAIRGMIAPAAFPGFDVISQAKLAELYHKGKTPNQAAQIMWRYWRRCTHWREDV